MAAKLVLEGITLVTIGAILLANTTGVLPWSVWWTILMLWPLLLVAAGIDILGRALNSSALRVLGSLVVIGGLVYGALAGGGRVQAPVFGTAGTQRIDYQVPADPAVSRGKATIHGSLGRLSVGPGEEFFGAAGQTSLGEPRQSEQRDDGTIAVEVGGTGGQPRVVFPGAGRSFLDVTMGRSVAWESVVIDAPLSQSRVDLSELDVAKLDATFGLSAATITFGTKAANAEASVHGGLSHLTLRFPKTLGVELASDNGLGTVSVPAEWKRTSGDGAFQGTWRSDGYDSSTSKLRIEVKTGLSGVDVQRY